MKRLMWCAAVCLSWVGMAHAAEAYPNRPVRVARAEELGR